MLCKYPARYWMSTSILSPRKRHVSFFLWLLSLIVGNAANPRKSIRTDRHQHFPGTIFLSTVTSDILNNKIYIFKWRDIWNPSLECRLYSNMWKESYGTKAWFSQGLCHPNPWKSGNAMTNPANCWSKTSWTHVLDQSPREDAPGSPTYKKGLSRFRSQRQTWLQQLRDGKARDLKESGGRQQTRPWVQERELQFVQSFGRQNPTVAAFGSQEQRTDSQS